MGWRQVAVQLEAHELVTATMKRTGLDDFGDGNWSEPLEVLCTALRREAGLDLAGRRWARGYLMGLLTTRAERAASSGTSPAATASEVESDAMTSDPTAEAPRPAVLAATPDQREPWRAGTPGDDDDELAFTLCSIRFEQWWHVPGYAEWLDGADLTDAYGQWATAPREGRGGVLHLENVPELRRVFPGATVLIRTGTLDDATEAMVAEVVTRRATAHSPSADVDRLRRYWGWRLERMLDRLPDGEPGSG